MKPGEDKIIEDYRKGGWVTGKQFQKLHPAHLRYIGKWNKSKKHKPKTAVKGKTNKDYPDKMNAYNKKQKENISKIPGKNARPTIVPGKVPRGSHRMPDGTIMKNKDMKKVLNT
jgi:hypothetical protein